MNPRASLTDRPVVIADPFPYGYSQILTGKSAAWLETNFHVIRAPDGEQLSAEEFDRYLGEAVAVIGLMDLERDRLDRAKKLKVIFNSGGNFRQNVDYEYCVDRRIHVLNCGPAYAEAVAELALGMAIDLGRGISREDRRFRQGKELYLFAGNQDSVSLFGARVGFIGYGYLGRELLPLVLPFRCPVKIYDPWLPDSVITKAGATPAGLDEVLSDSQFIFVLAGVTAENQGFLSGELLDLVSPGACFLLISRAAVIDFDAFLDRVQAGRFQAAIDVWPVEPAPADSRARGMENLILSAHRAGGISSAFVQIGDMICDDLNLIVQGLAPVRMQPAAWELIRRYRSQ